MQENWYFLFHVQLPDRASSDEFLVCITPDEELIEEKQKGESEILDDHLFSFIQSYHEDNIDTATWEKENDIEYEYDGSHTQISETYYRQLINENYPIYHDDSEIDENFEESNDEEDDDFNIEDIEDDEDNENFHNEVDNEEEIY